MSSDPDEDGDKDAGQGHAEPGGDANPDASPPDRTVIATPPEGIPDRTVISAEAVSSPPVPAASDPTLIGDQPAAQGGSVRLVEPGTLINNNYRINTLVSVGGMGEVYRAENVFTGDPVAVKVILPNLARDESVLDLFRREARVLVQLRDEAIVRYHNFVLDAGLGRYCLIMEFVEGRHLGTRIKEDGPLDDMAALVLMRRLAAGLGRAHARGVTHRDLSPDNVILRDDHIDEAVLIDFGIARSTELGDGLAGRFAGKFKYIAPEQLGHWGGEIGPRTDVYGLALLIATVARGKPLAMGDSVVSASAARQAIPDLTGVSHRLFPLLQHMLEPDPQRRPRDMAEVLGMIEDPMLLPAQYRLPLWSSAAAPASAEEGATVIAEDPATESHSPFAALSPAAPQPSAAAPPPARRGCWALAGVVLALLAGGAGYLALRPDAPAPQPDEVAQPAPAALAPRDGSTREGFLAEQPLPDCTLALRIGQGANAGMISVLAAGDFDASALVAAYDAAFGTRPSVVQERVGEAQCPALDFLREASGRPAPPPGLTADVDLAAEGFQVRGEVSNLSDRNLWLFLVAPDGAVYDLTGQSQRGEDGRDRFGVAIGTGAAEAGGAYLLVALSTEAPLASVAAAPAGSPAAQLLPRVLEELHGSGAAPALDVIVLKPENAQMDGSPT
ncbi:serine/threonine-protein kinase [Paracoccus siganidrum]|uniref:Serine/threonine protein kinase n=1 Tax=Paracoccus siganidrum TaxID=1276757 RepID=A0A419ACA1_9RHOB|nr:serine/threonine-protein kinase [Paracoccus siganidrum]RJL21838.1 serine/threonine protein kinase [Paracoccus siganidrum]RMC28836.1 serine/threonine protein kinase [Paracoccus siganidrum]